LRKLKRKKKRKFNFKEIGKVHCSRWQIPRSEGLDELANAILRVGIANAPIEVRIKTAERKEIAALNRIDNGAIELRLEVTADAIEKTKGHKDAWRRAR